MNMCNTCGLNIDEINTINTSIKIINNESIRIPFFCSECNRIKCNAKVTKDRVLVYEDEVPDKFKGTNIIIPESSKDELKTGYGFIISVGPGYYNKNGKFVFPSVKVGQRIMFDKSTPWSIKIEDSYGVIREIRLIGEQDIYGIIEEN